MTPVDQKKDLICRAIAERRILQFKYDGRLRIVEPFEFGKSSSSAADYVLRGFQIRGTDKTKPLCWRLYDLAGMSNVSLTQYRFPGSRREYDPDSQEMDEVCGRVA